MHRLHRVAALTHTRIHRYTPGDNNYKSIVLRVVFIGLFNANIASAIINCWPSRQSKIAHIIRTECVYHKRGKLAIFCNRYVAFS